MVGQLIRPLCLAPLLSTVRFQNQRLIWVAGAADQGVAPPKTRHASWQAPARPGQVAQGAC